MNKVTSGLDKITKYSYKYYMHAYISYSSSEATYNMQTMWNYNLKTSFL